MTKLIVIVLILFLIYEISFKDAFGVKSAVFNHFKVFDRGLYGILVTLLLPIFFLLIFRESHVYTARNLDNLLIVLSIFVSILFGIMGDITSKEISDHKLKDMTLSSAIFITLQCLVSMILTFGLMTSYTMDSDIDLAFKILNSFNFYLVFSILINTMLILSRFSKLIRD